MVGDMSENEPNLGSEEANQRNDFAAATPPADEVGPDVTPPSTVSGEAPAAAPVPQPPQNPQHPQSLWARPQDQPATTPSPPGLPTTHPYGQQPWATAQVPFGAPTPAPAANSPMPWRRAVIGVVAAAAIALTAGGVGGFVGYAMHGSSNGLQTITSAGKNTAPVVDRSSLASIAAAIQPDVVVIQTDQGEGSGVVISADGNIVTNNHVVDGASTVKVTFNSGKVVQGKVLGTDPKTDLAVVKVSGVSDLSFAAWGNSDDVQVGDTVLAIGSPLGLQGSVTAGIISALHRTISVGGEQQSRFSAPTAQTTIGDAIQTDAPINPGNSGGALVDTNGKVIGINSAIATQGSSGNIGVGFAIPANKAKEVAQELINGGKVSHPFLGVSVVDGQNGGAQVQSVQAGGPADKAGLKVGDVVTKVGNRAISSGDDLVGAIQSSTVGSTLTLTIDRNGTTQTVGVTVGESN
jgi:putative serine protease PepD